VPDPMAGFAVSLDRGSPVPLYFQVATQLEEMIESGEMPVGGRLANEVELADRLGVSRPTMRRAIQYLVERGMLVRKRGVGTQIVHPKVRRPVELSSLYDDLVKTGQSPVTEVLDFSVGPATKRMAERYGVPEGLEVTWFERLRHSGGEPLALMHNAVPTEILPLERADLERRGLYELLRAAGHVPRMATQVVGARAANAAEARVLGESRGAPLLTMSRTAWDERGEAVEYGAHVYRASRYSFELSLTV
jgi:DNA-binding GntR family transcriptional regulator